jgi:4-amino-4-deoxy-L-arabinose transferase-like glycosyltransferase
MSAPPAEAPGAPIGTSATASHVSVATVRASAAPLAVFAVALVARAVTATSIAFPIPEGSAYYVAAARSLATGRGLIVDVLWSYATPPLEVPRAAFDIWQPLGSLLATAAMIIFGPSLAAAQVSSVLLGGLAALLAWAIARDAAGEVGVAPSRRASVALGAGLLIALTPLLVIQGAEPDSSAPFTLFVLAACWLTPRTLDERRPGVGWRFALGIALGLAYLARQETIYLAVGYLVLAWLAGRGEGVRRALPAMAGAAVVAGPWFFRQAVTWSASPFGQLVENAWSVRSTDIFAWSERPTLAAHLALGPSGIVDLRLEALTGNAALVAVTAFPAVIVGLATLIAWPRLAALPALRLLAIGGLFTFLADSLVFPVASLAGLYAHGAGPTIVMFAALAGLGIDRVAARVAALRRWRPATSPFSLATLLTPVALVGVVLPFTVLGATLEHERSAELGAEYGALGAFAENWDVPSDRPVVSDHPMWTNAALDRPAVVLPYEGAPALVELARHFEAVAVIVRAPDNEASVDGLVGYQAPDGRSCFRALAAPPPFLALAFTCQ